MSDMNEDEEQDDGKPEYLGDGVYVKSDGYHIILMTGNHLEPDSEVFLDSHVLSAFMRWLKRRKKKRQDEIGG